MILGELLNPNISPNRKIFYRLNAKQWKNIHYKSTSDE